MIPAGWTLRNFSPDDLASLVGPSPQGLLEISKDHISDTVSLKELGRVVSALCASSSARVSFAGTTDLVQCAGLSWERYRRYLAVQIAQAVFLDSSMFRLFVGAPCPGVSLRDVTQRLNQVCTDLAPLSTCIEVHGGLESDIETLDALMRDTPVQIVLDIENMHAAGMTLDEVLAVVPRERFAYFHQRNLPGVWMEHPESRNDESRLHELFPQKSFLWEPKRIDDPVRIRELIREHHASH
jgi:hypothetical protein